MSPSQFILFSTAFQYYTSNNLTNDENDTYHTYGQHGIL